MNESDDEVGDDGAGGDAGAIGDGGGVEEEDSSFGMPLMALVTLSVAPTKSLHQDAAQMILLATKGRAE